MKKQPYISQEIDKLMDEAGSSARLKTSATFLSDLNSRLDEVDREKESTSVFSLVNVMKYAAILVFMALNIGALITASSSVETEAVQLETLSDVTDAYFPDYTYSELE